jgi:uracil-DNA glycosylase family 4
MGDRDARVAALRAYHEEQVAGCVRCALSEGRTQVVLGSGDPDADLMFVGEAPGYHEDRQGVPFVGQAGKLLDRLLAGIGLDRDAVFVANVLKCRPPGNRDPMPAEIRSCEPHLHRQISLVQPRVVCTLGNFATKLLSGRPDGISRVHGNPLPMRLGGREVLLYPLLHPAAALYTRSMLATLEEDFARIPELLAGRASESPPAPVPTRQAPPPPPLHEPEPEPEPEPELEPARREPAVAASAHEQLGLF